MINYTERIALLMQDVVRRTPALSFINLSELLVFARFGRALYPLVVLFQLYRSILFYVTYYTT